MRLISAGSLVRAQSGPPKSAKRKNTTVFVWTTEEIPESKTQPARRPVWFFDIYIQGSNTTFRAESETRLRASAAREFQLSQICAGQCGRCIRLIKLQRAHNGCLCASRR